MAKRGLSENKKLPRLAIALGMPLWAAAGLLEMFWHWTARNAMDGFIAEADFDSAAFTIRFDQGGGVLLDVLLKTGWLDQVDGGYWVHDWDEHADEAVRKVLRRRGQNFANGSTAFGASVAQKAGKIEQVSPLSRASVAPTSRQRRANVAPTARLKPEPEPEPDISLTTFAICAREVSEGSDEIVQWWHGDERATQVMEAVLSVPCWANLGEEWLPTERGVRRILARLDSLRVPNEELATELESFAAYYRTKRAPPGQTSSVAKLNDWFSRAETKWRSRKTPSSTDLARETLALIASRPD